jgi:hypothetical protein
VTRRASTRAELNAFLRGNALEGVEDAFERIRVNLDGVREDLASAADDVNASRSRTAASDVEDAAMLLGEAIAFALGYRIAPGDGHHWRAVRVLVLYLQSSVPALADKASQFELLRSYRNRVKYDGAEAPMAQTRAYFSLLVTCHEAIKHDPLRLLAERQKLEG